MSNKLTLFAFLYLAQASGAYALSYTYESGVKAKATKAVHPVTNEVRDLGQTSDQVYYQVFKGQATNPIASCILLHGHGFNKKYHDTVGGLRGKTILDFLTDMDQLGEVINQKQQSLGDIKRSAPRLGRFLETFVPQASQALGEHMTPMYRRNYELLTKLDVVGAFGMWYFGWDLVTALQEQTCQAVYIPVQESVQTSLQELTVRSERFLRDVACRADKPGTCAVLGHSKAGAAVTSIMRRCSESRGELGEASCQRLSHVYSAAGMNQGTGIPIVYKGLLGLKQNIDNLKTAAGAVSAIGNFFGALEVPEDYDQKMADGIKKLKELQASEMDESKDLFGLVTDDTNPVWLDLGPLSPVDGEKPGTLAPIGRRHGKTFFLKSGGYLNDRVQYAAAAGAYQFNGKGYEKVQTEERSYYIYAEGEKDRLHSGLPDAIANLSDPFFINVPFKGPITFGKDSPLAQKLARPFLHLESKAIVMVIDKSVELHGDANMETVYDGGAAAGLGVGGVPALKKELKLLSKPSELELPEGVTPRSWTLTVPRRGKGKFLDNYTLNPVGDTLAASIEQARQSSEIAFHLSDGIVEVGSALGPCYRTQENPAAGVVVLDNGCKTFDNLNHLAASGMSTEVTAHILEMWQE